MSSISKVCSLLINTKKCPDCLCPWLEFMILKAFLRVFFGFYQSHWISILEYCALPSIKDSRRDWCHIFPSNNLSPSLLWGVRGEVIGSGFLYLLLLLQPQCNFRKLDKDIDSASRFFLESQSLTIAKAYQILGLIHHTFNYCDSENGKWILYISLIKSHLINCSRVYLKKMIIFLERTHGKFCLWWLYFWLQIISSHQFEPIPQKMFRSQLHRILHIVNHESCWLF